MADYVFDKDSQIEFEKIINGGTYESKGISDDGLELLIRFYENNVYKIVPESLFGEYFRSDFSNYRSISSGIPEVVISRSNNRYEFNFGKEKDRRCQEFEITSKGKVHVTEIEGITFCLKKEKTFVTGDKPAQYLCSCLGVSCINIKDFIKKVGINNYLI